MKLGRSAVALAVAGLLVGGVLFGTVVTGHAAPTQKVTASLNCEPAAVKTGRTAGCMLTVTNEGNNTVNQVVVTVEAPGGTFLSSSSGLCAPNGSMLTCEIGQLSGVGTSGSIFTETHELQMPSSGASVVQTASGRYSPNPNNRGSDTIAPVSKTTTQDSSIDFDARFANSGADTVQTDSTISGNNPYTTGAELFGGSFTVGLSVRERGAGASNPNCPTGCFGGQVIDFDITPLSGTDFPTGYTLLITIADEAIPNSVKADELDVRHTTDLGTELVPLCPDTDSAGACIVDRTITRPTKNGIIVITGPGDGNGSWGVG